MKSVVKGNLPWKDIVGPHAFDSFPDNFTPPWQVYVRQTYHDHGGSVEATWPGVGVVTLQRGRYHFAFEESYASLKGYPIDIEGEWG